MSIHNSWTDTFSNFFHAVFSKARTEEERATNLRLFRLTDVASMPRKTQLLLAHSLQRNDPYITLQDRDEDAACLIANGLLNTIECTTIGIACYRIKPFFWHRLKTNSGDLLNLVSDAEIDSYRKTKSANYPWVW